MVTILEAGGHSGLSRMAGTSLQFIILFSGVLSIGFATQLVALLCTAVAAAQFGRVETDARRLGNGTGLWARISLPAPLDSARYLHSSDESDHVLTYLYSERLIELNVETWRG